MEAGVRTSRRASTRRMRPTACATTATDRIVPASRLGVIGLDGRALCRRSGGQAGRAYLERRQSSRVTGRKRHRSVFNSRRRSVHGGTNVPDLGPGTRYREEHLLRKYGIRNLLVVLLACPRHKPQKAAGVPTARAGSAGLRDPRTGARERRHTRERDFYSQLATSLGHIASRPPRRRFALDAACAPFAAHSMAMALRSSLVFAHRGGQVFDVRGRFLVLARPLERSFGLALAWRSLRSSCFFVCRAHCFIIDVGRHTCWEWLWTAFAKRDCAVERRVIVRTRHCFRGAVLRCAATQVAVAAAS